MSCKFHGLYIPDDTEEIVATLKETMFNPGTELPRSTFDPRRPIPGLTKSQDGTYMSLVRPFIVALAAQRFIVNHRGTKWEDPLFRRSHATVISIIGLWQEPIFQVQELRKSLEGKYELVGAPWRFPRRPWHASLTLTSNN